MSAAEKFRQGYGQLFSDGGQRDLAVNREQQWALPPAGEYRARTLLRDRRGDVTPTDRTDRVRLKVEDTSAGRTGRDTRIYHIASLGAEEVGRNRVEFGPGHNDGYRAKSFDAGAGIGNLGRNVDQAKPERLPSAVGRRLRLGQIAHSHLGQKFQSAAPAGKPSPQHPRNFNLGIINQSLDSSPLPSFAPRKKPHPRKEELLGGKVRDIFKVNENVPYVNLKALDPAASYAMLEERPRLAGQLLRHREPKGTYNFEEELREKQGQDDFSKKKSLERLSSRMTVLGEYQNRNLRGKTPDLNPVPRPVPTSDAKLRHSIGVNAPNSALSKSSPVYPPIDDNIELSAYHNHSASDLSPVVALQTAMRNSLQNIRTGRKLDKCKIVVAAVSAVRECLAIRRIIGMEIHASENSSYFGKHDAPVGYAYGVGERLSEIAHSESQARAKLGTILFQVFTDSELIEILQEMVGAEEPPSAVRDLVSLVERRCISTMVGRRGKEQRMHRKVFRD